MQSSMHTKQKKRWKLMILFSSATQEKKPQLQIMIQSASTKFIDYWIQFGNLCAEKCIVLKGFIFHSWVRTTPFLRKKPPDLCGSVIEGGRSIHWHKYLGGCHVILMYGLWNLMGLVFGHKTAAGPHSIARLFCLRFLQAWKNIEHA